MLGTLPSSFSGGVVAKLDYRGTAPGGLALSKSSTTLDHVECAGRSCEVELDEGRASEEDDSINGDARNVSKGHGMVETNNVVTFRC